MFDAVLNAIDRTNDAVGRHVALLYLPAVIVTTYEVVMRYVFNSPTVWAFELTIMLCATAYLLAGGYVTGKDRQISITILRDAASPSVRWYLDLTSILVGLACTGVVTWAGIKPALRSVAIFERTGSSWNPPMPAIIKPMIVVAAGLIFLQLISNLVRHLRSPAMPAGGHGGA